MNRRWHTPTPRRSLIALALTIVFTGGCAQPTPQAISSTLPVPPATSIVAGPAAQIASATAQEDQPIYYLYILDRDGAPVQRFECTDRSISYSYGVARCTRPDGRDTTVSEAVPVLLTPDRIPLKSERP